MPWQAPVVDTVEITAERLHLRPWGPADAAVVLRAFQDPMVQRWTHLPQPYTEVHARSYVTNTAPRGWVTGDDLPFAVCDSTTGDVLAHVSSRAVEPGVRAVGYWALPEARGQGVVTAALVVLCRWSFAELGVQRLSWRAAVGNVASRRVAERAGFTVEGVARRALLGRDGAAVDAWVGARLPGDPDVDTARFPAYNGPGDGVVRLRRWRPADAADVGRACADPEVARWLPVPSPYRVEDAREFVEELTVTQWLDGRVANVAVTDAATGALLGACGLTVRDGGVGEVGYWTAPWARGRGVAGRAARLHARWGLEALGLARVELLADVGNSASQRAAERAGFVREGVARAVRPRLRSTERTDMVVFALTR